MAERFATQEVSLTAFGATFTVSILHLGSGIWVTRKAPMIARTRTGTKVYPVDATVKQDASGNWILSGTRTTVLRKPATITGWVEQASIKNITARNGWQS